MLSNTCKYAIRSLIYLAKKADEGTPKVGIKKISDDLGIPSPFLGKILQSLARKKILISTKGPHGGFGLGKEPENISLYDIVVHVDGSEYFDNCIIRLEPCSCFTEDDTCCPIHKRFSQIRDELEAFYKETSLGDIVDDYAISGEIIRF